MKNTMYSLMALIIVSLFWGAAVPLSCIGPYSLRGLPLVVEYTVTPDIDCYEKGQLVTLEYTITLDKTSADYVPGVEYLPFTKDYTVGYKYYGLIVRNDMDNNTVISDNNPIHNNVLAFKLTEDTARFFCMLRIYRLCEPSKLPVDSFYDKIYRNRDDSPYYNYSTEFYFESISWKAKTEQQKKSPTENYPVITPQLQLNRNNRTPSGDVYGVLLNTTIRFDYSDGLVSEPYIDQPYDGYIGVISNYQNNYIELTVTNNASHEGNSAEIFINSTDHFTAEVVLNYPLVGKITFEEHSPFQQDGLAFFREPGYVGGTSGYLSPGIGTALLIDADTGLEISEVQIGPDGVFDFGEVSVGRPCIMICIRDDNVELFTGDVATHNYYSVNQGIILYHPERFFFVWNSYPDNLINITVQINPIDESDSPYSLIDDDPHEPLHMIIKDHNFCAASHVYKEYYRAREALQTLNPSDLHPKYWTEINESHPVWVN